jgi:hypothetical protein
VRRFLVADAKSEMDVFFPDNKMTLVNGEVLDIPKLTWKSESKAIKLVGRIFNDVPVFKQINFSTVTGKDLLMFLPALLEKAPDYITELVAVITKKEATWLDEHMTAEDMMGIIVPFFARLLKILGKAVPTISEKTVSPPALISSGTNTAGQPTPSSPSP